MPGAVSPPRPGDPSEVGGHRVLGRLGSGGQGVVYLAESGRGERVAVKVLHATGDPEADARFRREAEVLPRVASFCTAQVLQVGTADGLPYIVSEFIEGPTLQQAVAERGPLRGQELRRLAIGTVTALAAIHRAGVVHRDLKPANVLLGPDGPRVIDFGIARAFGPGNAVEITGEGVLGTPAYMAPEQLRGAPPAPAADMFAWAGVVVFAATGVPPFGHDTVPAIIRRVLTEEPDLGALDGDLREVASECLRKDPAARPAAAQALLRLLGRPAENARPAEDTAGLLHRGSDAASGRPESAEDEAAVPGGRIQRGRIQRGRIQRGRIQRGGEKDGGEKRTSVRRAVAAACAGVVLSAGVAAYVATRPDVPPPRPRPALSGPPAPVADRVAVPELRATLYEAPGDPVRVTSFLVQTGPFSQPAYVREPGRAAYEKLDGLLDPVVSPDGRLVAAVAQTPQRVSDLHNQVLFTDRGTGERFSVPTVDRPLLAGSPEWSRDSRRLLLTVSAEPDRDPRPVGFAVVDVPARKVSFTEVEGEDEKNAPAAAAPVYRWTPDGSAVIRQAAPGADGIRVYDLDGTPRRTIDGVRWTADAGFSPSGRLLAALCPGDDRRACVVDADSGRRRASLPLPADGALWGWFNEDHLLVFDKGSTPWRVHIVDLSGRRVRLFAEITGTKDTYWLLHITPG
ncbi:MULTISPECIES: serine/threonine-protein kinase [unclassified Microbispora]|uniref:serine/threonine-protein kinase n=1 Tax=unclassified Microbispora TaxID=2614687 RepID=UPI001438E0AF|nr:MULTISPECIES: serine/threonine-protein kinase [unclassified Microbispora]NJP23648.1 protein kinase [Microbispora sp. CL1-1]